MFFDEGDKEKYLELLCMYSVKRDTPVLAYCMMDNHIHLLVKPLGQKSLQKMMQGVAQGYTKYLNAGNGRTGRLWESRYHSCIVDKERYLWAVARYIEQNPVRAGLVRRAEEYAFSSARAHVSGNKDLVLGEELFEDSQRKDYTEMLRTGLPEKQASAIRYTTRTGWPIGEKAFIDSMESKLGRQLRPKSVGRPKHADK